MDEARDNAQGVREEWEPEEETGLFEELWRTGAWRLLPLMLLYVASLTVLSPVKPDIMTDFFASRNYGGPLRCETFPIKEAPKWSSWTDFFANSVLSFYFAPKVGVWSDMYGRKPFLMLAYAFAGGPMFVLLGNLTFGLSLFFYFPAAAMSGAISSIVISLAYVSDLMRPSLRGPCFGLIIGSFSIGFLIGPAFGRVLPQITAAYIGVGGVVICILCVLVLPETLTATQKMQARRRYARNQKAGKSGLWAGVSILTRSPLFIKLTICLMLTGMVSEGLYELLMQYFQLKLGFTQQDQGLLLEIAGTGGLLVQTFVLRWTLQLFGPTRTLIFGLLGSAVQQVMLAYAPSKLFAFIAIGIGTLSNVGFPAISSIKANNVQDYEQGLIQGALYAAKSLAQGLGPVTFAALFSAFSRSDSPLPYFPGAPFLFGAGVSLIAVVVACTIDAASADVGVQQLPEVHFDDTDTDTDVLLPASPGSAEGRLGERRLSLSPEGPTTRNVKKPALSIASPSVEDAPAPKTPEQWPGRASRATGTASADVSGMSGTEEGAASPGVVEGLLGNIPHVVLSLPERVVWAPLQGRSTPDLESEGSIPVSTMKDGRSHDFSLLEASGPASALCPGERDCGASDPHGDRWGQFPWQRNLQPIVQPGSA